MSKRFTITASKETSFLIDNENELSALPLYFHYNDLSDEDKEKVEEWLDFLNRRC